MTESSLYSHIDIKTNLSRRKFALGTALALACPAIANTAVPLPQPRGVIRSAWWNDPFAQGSYSHLGREGTREDRVALGDVVGGRIVLAGEGTEPDYPSTVHGAILSGRRSAEQLLELDVADVAIVGAGAAGLAAAEHLLSEGLRVDLIEARGRVGGRIVTDRSLGFAADLGASWIHGRRDNPVTEIAHSLGLSLLTSNWENHVIRNQEGALTEMPDWLEIHSEANLDYADDAYNLSAHAMDEGESFEGEDVLIAGGYDQILGGFDLQSASLHLNSPVSRIAYSENGVTVSGEWGSLNADAAIVTLPIGVLQSRVVQFLPALPLPISSALSRLRMGSLEKVFLTYDEVFWDYSAEVIMASDAQDGAFAAFVNLAPLTGQAAIMALNGGDYARSLARWGQADLGRLAHDAFVGLYF